MCIFFRIRWGGEGGFLMIWGNKMKNWTWKGIFFSFLFDTFPLKIDRFSPENWSIFPWKLIDFPLKIDRFSPENWLIFPIKRIKTLNRFLKKILTPLYFYFTFLECHQALNLGIKTSWALFMICFPRILNCLYTVDQKIPE